MSYYSNVFKSVQPRVSLVSLIALSTILASTTLLAQQPVDVVPTTTLAIETGNNTSTANSFLAQSNGNLGPGNVSKVPVGPMMNGGATPVFAHFMGWFGNGSHMNVGYDSADPAQIAKQVDDMMSRGLRGAIVDWYGPGSSHTNTATINLMKEAENRNGNFEFALTIDGGALSQCSVTPGCDLTTELVNDMYYAYNTFEKSPAYFRVDGRPVVLFFDVERFAFYGIPQYSIDWSRVAADVPGNPLLIFRNSGGFTHTGTSGSFGWVIINSQDANDWGQDYLSYFYSTAQFHPNELAFGATYKGFNDSLAGWGAGRVMNQNCGQTWLNTFGQINSQYSASNPLPFLQLVTWNDYEEATELESGIDNCAAVTTSLGGSTLNWELTRGNSNTIDHYEVFVGLDDRNLMPLASVAATNTSLDLTKYLFASGMYTFYVKAVGLPSFRNQMSNPARLVPGDKPPKAALSLSRHAGHGPLTVHASALGSSDSDGTINSYEIDFGDGTVVDRPTASHTFQKPGSYRVLATVFDNAGSSSATAKVVTVTDTPPSAQVTLSTESGVAPLVVTADASGSFDMDGSIVSTSINFGDGTTVVNGATGSHTYTKTGNYTVKVTVTDNLGVSSAATATVSVAGPTVTILTPSNGASVSSPAHVSATATAQPGRAISSMMLYVDGQLVASVAGATLSSDATLQSADIHTIEVKATDNAGATASSRIAVYGAIPPETVTVWSPTNNTVVDSPVHVVASATSNHAVVAMQIYLDHVLYKQFDKVSSIDTYVPMRSGLHYLSVKAWTDASTNFMTGRTITVAQTSSCQTSTVAETVTICSPLNGSTVGSPVHVVAGSTSNSLVTAMQIYVDNILYHTYDNVSSIDTFVPMTGGVHYVVVKAWTSAGSFLSAVTISVSSASCPLDATPESVTICSPQPDSTVSSPVHVNAGATSVHTVTAMQIYVDNVLYKQVNGSSLDTDLPLPVGKHYVVVQAWTNLGTTFLRGVNIAVQ